MLRVERPDDVDGFHRQLLYASRPTPWTGIP
jgi:hypothetical protein